MNKTLNKDNKSLSLSERDNLQKPKKKIFSIISGNDNSFLKKKSLMLHIQKTKKIKKNTIFMGIGINRSIKNLSMLYIFTIANG